MKDIKILGDRLLVRRDSPETKTASGILFPKAAIRKSETGEVVRVGNGNMLGCGVRRQPSVKVGDNILFTNAAYEPLMLDDVEHDIIDGNCVFAYAVTEGFTHKGDCTIVFKYQAVRDIVFVLPSLPPQKLGTKGIIEGTPNDLKSARSYTGTVLSAGAGYISVKTGKFCQTDLRLKSGDTVNYDINVPWGIWVKDTEGNPHYVSVCGVSDIRGILN